MRFTIYKYPLGIMAEQTLLVSRRRRILDIQTQGDTPCLWILVDLDFEMTPLNIYIQGTGLDADLVAAKTYIGTFQLQDGTVWHVFVDNK